MIKVLFVCLGNICRSPMAEFIFKDMIKRQGIEDRFYEKRNVENIMKITGGDPDGKIRLLLDYTDRKGDISDPWFTRDFDRAYNDILDGVTGFLKFLKQGRLYE